MPTQPLPKDHPLITAWEAYIKTKEYDNSIKWAAYPEHRTGSLWAAFKEGWHAAYERVQNRKAKRAANAIQHSHGHSQTEN